MTKAPSKKPIVAVAAATKLAAPPTPVTPVARAPNSFVPMSAGPPAAPVASPGEPHGASQETSPAPPPVAPPPAESPPAALSASHLAPLPATPEVQGTALLTPTHGSLEISSL
jgi:hypothetical protein